MAYPASPDDAGNSRVRLDSAQFWAGVAATAVVAALIALVGILICRWTLNIPILAPVGDGAWGNAHTTEYVLASAAAAIVAGGLLYLLVLGAPRPRLFFGWILGLATLAAVVYPFSTSAPLGQKAATAVVDLVLGIAIMSLLAAVAARAVRRPLPPPPPNRDGYRNGIAEQGYGPGYGQQYPPERRGTRPTQPINVPPSHDPRRWE
ncbi:MAG: DUF6069 family protein [Trebonia sp.]